MKIPKLALIFYGSPHREGYTKSALDYFVDSMKESCEFKVINCYERQVKPCVDCGHCRIEANCIYKDMDDINEDLKRADILVFASPIYNFSFPAPLKAMLDRMQRYFNERFFLNIIPPIKKRKKAALLLTCGKNETIGKEIIEQQLNKIFTIINAYTVASVLWKGTDYLKNKKLAPTVQKEINKVIIELKNQ